MNLPNKQLGILLLLHLQCKTIAQKSDVSTGKSNSINLLIATNQYGLELCEYIQKL